MSVRKICLLLVFVVLLTHVFGCASNPRFANTIGWGTASNGFRLGTELEEPAWAVHCWLQNATTNDLELNTCALGRWDSLNLLVQSDGEMKPLARIPCMLRPLEGIGPTAYRCTNINANAVLAPVQWKWMESSRRADSAPTFRHFDIPSPSPRNSSFDLDLLDFEWPQNCFTNRYINIQIVETLFRERAENKKIILYSNDWHQRQIDSFTIQSAVVRIDAKNLSALFRRLPCYKPPTLEDINYMLKRPAAK